VIVHWLQGSVGTAKRTVGRPAMSEQRPVVLMVGTDPSLTRLVRACLDDDGLRVVVQDEGDRAAAGDGVQPDVVVVDAEAVGAYGAALVRALHPDGQRTPVLVLSSYDARRVAHDFEAQQWLAKPFHPDDLIRCVRALLPGA
jgi:DNA-binding response OmpR family regulator